MKRYVHTKICTGSFSEAFILHHQKPEPVNKSFNMWMDKQTVLPPQVEYPSVRKRNDCLNQCIKNNWQDSTPFPDKNNKLGIEVNYLNIINALYEKPSVNIILSRKRQKGFFSKIRIRKGCLLLPLLLSIVLKVWAMQLGKKRKEKTFKLENKKKDYICSQMTWFYF